MICPILSIGKEEPVQCVKKNCQLWTGIMMKVDRGKKEPLIDCAFVLAAVKGEDGLARKMPDVKRSVTI